MLKIEDLFAAGMHYGHNIRRSSSKMKKYVYGERWGISVIDLCQTAILFDKALNQLQHIVSKGGRVLFVGTKYQAKDLVEQAAKDSEQSFITKRWLGGTITNNYSTVGVLSQKLNKMERDEEAGYVSKLSKNEQSKFAKKKEKYLGLISGVRNLNSTPDVLIVVDAKREAIAISEAYKLGIPVIALADTDALDPTLIKYIVPGNDEGTASIKLFLDNCVQIINESKKAKKPQPALEKEKANG
jgi:small subunit ribosomal protein S2